MRKTPRNTGFNGRMFLDEVEWRTYCRRKPVRYIRKQKESVCHVCGEPPVTDNPFQHAHIISFDIGVIDLALTPDYLDSDANIATAHRVTCNNATELGLRASMERLHSIGVQALPGFLPQHIQQIWDSVVKAKG